ncbi:hypothetical protein BLA60_34470 [Actinophytocola xinjiangensis]|uniref:Uncharacterized protein n=1 Tax=Actinophytocola xinjiangensis TaxID=485602 RepID=A0A7Z0WFU2_9PSEU|nr:hypothetical protein [Actinophytocola xinjiangensis]OLF05886.1 hypothetical protein BLA60_34470 [Actinophytocola xinjiangensis]
MNVTDLRTSLRDRADTVTDPDPGARATQVQARIRALRRRRVTGVAALTVGTLAVVGTAGFLSAREPDGAEIAGQDPAATTITHENFVSHSGAYDLIGATMGKPGESTLEVTIPAPKGKVRIMMVCYGDLEGPDHWVSGYTGDSRPDRPDSNWCGGEPTTPVVPALTGTAPGPYSYDPGLTAQPEGDQLTVHVELTQEVDKNGNPIENPDDTGTYVPVSDPNVVLGVGIYSIAPPETTVAGAEIPSLIGLDGEDYAYREHRTSRLGERELTWEIPASDTVRHYDVVAKDSRSPGVTGAGVEAVLDGTSCRFNYGLPTFRAGGCLLDPGEPHTITVTIPEQQPPATAELGIVLYEKVRP